ncbi:MAG: ABC transporter permease [Muricomes sp.]
MSTKRFIFHKIIQLCLTLFFVTGITFILMRFSPIDAAEAYARRSFRVSYEDIELIREQMGLNKSLIVQYADWLGKAVRLDFGKSLVNNRDVFTDIMGAGRVSALIVLLAAVIQAVGALIFGGVSYLTRRNITGKILRILAIAAISIPAFYIASIFIDVLAVRWKWIGVAGNTGFMRYFPAAFCLSVGGIAFFGQMIEKAITRAMNDESILYARCRGLSDKYLVARYAAPQAVISIVPTFMQMMGMCMAGSAIVENIFSLPGLGYLIIQSLINRDLPVIFATVLFLAFALALFNILADIIQRILLNRQGG